MMRPVRTSLGLLVLVGAFALSCGDKKDPQPEPKAAPAPSSPSAQPPPATLPPAPSPVKIARADRATCEKVADHVNRIVLATTTTDETPATEKRQLATLAAARRDSLVTFCTETTVPAEAECILAANTARQMFDCGRISRQIPDDLLNGDTVTEEHCELFFFRLRQFKILEGVAPSEIDKDHDQLVRKCQEEARPGTLACFLAAPDYETARRCP